MRRREFIALLGGAAGSTLPARARQKAMPVIGVAQMTDPFEALAQSKRQQIELEKRMKRDAAEQKKRQNTQKA